MASSRSDLVDVESVARLRATLERKLAKHVNSNILVEKRQAQSSSGLKCGVSASARAARWASKPRTVRGDQGLLGSKIWCPRTSGEVQTVPSSPS